MGFEKKDHDELLERQLRDQVEQRRPALERNLMAGAAMENMTGSPAWDFYLNTVGTRLDFYRAAVAKCDQILLGPEVNQDAIMTAKLERAGAAAAIEALEWASKLPKQVIEEAKRSKKALDT